MPSLQHITVDVYVTSKIGLVSKKYDADGLSSKFPADLISSDDTLSS